LKLYTKWSKSISVTYLVVGDFREVQQNKNIRDKVTSQVNTKWEESYNQSKRFLIKHCHHMMRE
jgi:hypothetical protein